MSKTIQLQPVNKTPMGKLSSTANPSITVILSGDTLQIGGTRYRLNKYDYTTLSIWVDDNKPIYNKDRRYVGDQR